ncbi:hypothetical protein J6590_033493 [Homalodisca vitripennis]|nr:hypothetical protein J6590_033493 [Homalodisca vitripennis]
MSRQPRPSWMGSFQTPSRRAQALMDGDASDAATPEPDTDGKASGQTIPPTCRSGGPTGDPEMSQKLLQGNHLPLKSRPNCKLRRVFVVVPRPRTQQGRQCSVRCWGDVRDRSLQTE